MKTSFLRPCVLGLAIAATSVVHLPTAQAKPKAKAKANMSTSRLEIWPAQRTLIVLPLTVSETFLTTDGSSTGGAGSSALAKALVPLVSPQLSSALQSTGKFSISRPYKFDPLLRRALLEQQLTDADIDPFVLSPSLDNAQVVLAKLGLDQPGMVAQVSIQSLRIGGTSLAPTVQMTVRGDLYESSSVQPFRSITVTSKPFPGLTPEERLTGAAGEAFEDIAAAFVAPPVEFDLPVPTKTGTEMMTGATPGGTTPGGTVPATPTGEMPIKPAGGGGMMMPMTPATPAMPMTPVAPLAPNGTDVGGAPVAPQLPAATPPLGVNVPEGN